MSLFWGGAGEHPSVLALGWHTEKQLWVWVWEPCTGLAVLMPLMVCGEGGLQPQEASLDKTQFPSRFPATTAGTFPSRRILPHLLVYLGAEEGRKNLPVVCSPGGFLGSAWAGGKGFIWGSSRPIPFPAMAPASPASAGSLGGGRASKGEPGAQKVLGGTGGNASGWEMWLSSWIHGNPAFCTVLGHLGRVFLQKAPGTGTRSSREMLTLGSHQQQDGEMRGGEGTQG